MNKINTNIAYMIAGVIIAINNPLIGILTVFLGFASMYSHKTGDYFIDWFMMWVVFYAIIAHYTNLWHIMIPLCGLTILIAETHLKHIPKIWVFNPQYYVLGLVWFTGFILSFYHEPVWQSLAYGGIFLIAILIRHKHHDIWHILTALGLMILFI